jgi:hypothetical protein
MRQFEYKRLLIDSFYLEETLNEYGQSGWELVQYDLDNSFQLHSPCTVTLKREIAKDGHKPLPN